MNEVTLHRARLVLGWVTAFGPLYGSLPAVIGWNEGGRQITLRYTFIKSMRADWPLTMRVQ